MRVRLWVGNQMANSSDCLPKAGAFLETVPSPFTHPVAMRWTSSRWLHFTNRRLRPSLLTGLGYWGPWGPWEPCRCSGKGAAPSGAILESHLWQSLIKALQDVVQHLAPMASTAKSGPLPVSVNKVLSEQTCLLYLLSMALFALQGQS